MNIHQIETLKGLVKSNDISDLGFLKRSSCTNFFEDATHFTKAVLKDLIIDSEKHLETEYFEGETLENLILSTEQKRLVEHQIFDLFSFMVSKQIIHGDINVSNIISKK